jgi:hypothetical protein
MHTRSRLQDGIELALDLVGKTIVDKDKKDNKPAAAGA